MHWLDVGNATFDGRKSTTSCLQQHLICITINTTAAQEAGVKENIIDEFGELHASGIHIVGRIVLNLWRQMQASKDPPACRNFEPLEAGAYQGIAC